MTLTVAYTDFDGNEKVEKRYFKLMSIKNKEENNMYDNDTTYTDTTYTDKDCTNDCKVSEASLTDVVKENTAFINLVLQNIRRLNCYFFGAEDDRELDIHTPGCLMEELVDQTRFLKMSADELARINSMLGI